MNSLALRRYAERLMEQKRQGLAEKTADCSFADEELEVYQLELSIQNEELQRIGLENELARDKYMRLYDFAPVGFFTLAANGRILEVNRNGAALFGAEKTHLLGKVFTSFVATEHQDTFSAYCQRLQRTKIKLDCELKLLKNDGTVYYALMDGIAANEKDENSTFCFVTVMDITERKKNEDERLKYDRLDALGLLAGGVAHDLNNLLTVILGNISLAKRKFLAAEKSDELLSEAEKACRQLEDLTKQLLTLAKGGTPIKGQISIAELFQASVTFAMRGSNVRYELDLPDDLWLVKADGGQISQVVNNLIINAKQAMPDGGTLSLGCENISVIPEDGLPLTPGPYLKITVKDHGVGIPKDQLDRIFDPYFTTKAQGSGLGLATSYSIVKKHEGHIYVESVVDIGTTVYVYLPALTGAGTALSGEKTGDLPLMGRGKILVMDDQVTVRNVIGDTITQLGYTTSFAANEEEAVRFYRDAKEKGEAYDAVILDLTVPGEGGGKHVITELLRIDPDVKAIISSGYCNNAVITDYKSYGFKGVISKPFCLEDISKALWDIISISA